MRREPRLDFIRSTIFIFLSRTTISAATPSIIYRGHTMSPSLSIAAILGLSVLLYQSKNVKDKIPIVKKHALVLFTVYMEIVMLYYRTLPVNKRTK